MPGRQPAAAKFTGAKPQQVHEQVHPQVRPQLLHNFHIQKAGTNNMACVGSQDTLTVTNSFTTVYQQLQ